MYVKASDPGAGGPPLDPHVRVYENGPSGDVLYEGWALPGTATWDPAWAIRRHVYSSSGHLERSDWANGSATMNNVWDNRTSLKYA